MQICGGEEEEETQCCFFDESVHNQRSSARPSKQNAIGIIKHRNTQKGVHAPHKQARLISKNSKKQKSQQKTKLSLSKLSGRKGYSSRDHCTQIQTNTQVGSVHSSAPKPIQFHNCNPIQRSNPYQSQHNNYTTNVRTEWNPSSVKEWYQPPMPTFEQKPQSARLHNYHNHIIKPFQQSPPIGANQYYQHQLQPNFAQVLWGNKYMPQHQFTLDRREQQSGLGNKDYREEQRFTFKNSPHFQKFELQNDNANQIHFQDERKLKASSFLTPMQASQNLGKNHKNKLSLSRQKNFHMKAKQKQFAESRYTDERSVYLQAPHLKTVQSMYSQDMNIKKQVHESIIVMDFFNPPQNFRKQMQEKISRKYSSGYNAFMN